MKIFRALYSIYTILIFICLLVIGIPIFATAKIAKGKTREQIVYFYLKFFGTFWCYLVGIVPINYNREKIKIQESVVMIANHQSYFDPVEMYTAFNFLFKALGKIEVSKTPLFGIIYSLAVVPIDRTSMRGRVKSFRLMQTFLKKNIPLLVYPEGTFPDVAQNELLPFQDGAFALAIESQKDIYPILFLDSAKRMRPNDFLGFTPGPLRTIFLPPISVQGLEKKDLAQVKERCQNYMQSCLDRARRDGPEKVWKFASKELTL